jgi:transposase
MQAESRSSPIAILSAIVGGPGISRQQPVFIQLHEMLGYEVWIGDASQIRASYVRKQKTDKLDATHILNLLVEGRFQRIWIPDAEMSDQGSY